MGYEASFKRITIIWEICVYIFHVLKDSCLNFSYERLR